MPGPCSWRFSRRGPRLRATLGEALGGVNRSRVWNVPRPGAAGWMRWNLVRVDVADAEALRHVELAARIGHDAVVEVHRARRETGAGLELAFVHSHAQRHAV